VTMFGLSRWVRGSVETFWTPFSTRRSFAVWRRLRSVNRAVEQMGQSYYRRNNDGDYFVYCVCGWGVASDCTVVVSVDDESLD
jgi:hypothetical protein